MRVECTNGSTRLESISYKKIWSEETTNLIGELIHKVEEEQADRLRLERILNEENELDQCVVKDNRLNWIKEDRQTTPKQMY